MGVKIGIAQLKVYAGSPLENLQKILEFIYQAKKQDCDLVIFPEMVVPGYMLSDLWEDTAFVTECNALNKQIGAASRGISVVWGNVLTDPRQSIFDETRVSFGNDGRLRKYNAAFAAQNSLYVENQTGFLQFNNKTIFPQNGAAIKTHEPLYREFEDQRHFISSKELSQQTSIPVENFINPFELQGVQSNYKLGVAICEDVWIGDYVYNGKTLNPVKILAEKGADMVAVISTSPYGLRKEFARERNIWRVFNELQKANLNVPLVYVNAVGTQNNGKNEYGFEGHSTIYDSAGNKVFSAPAWKEGLFVHTVSLVKEKQKVTAVFPTTRQPKVEEREELLSALVEIIQDFSIQKKINKYVVGMSGGADSALVAYLCVQAVGKEHVLGVNIPTKFNSDWTKSTAKFVADRLGIAYQVVPIEDLVENVRKKISSVEFAGDFGNFGSKHRERVIDENIQARTRIADIVSGISAKYPNTVYTCNGNKTEILLGWFTLDGDGRGAISPIGDLYKTQVIDLCAHINETYLNNKQEIIFPWELIAPVFNPLRYFDSWDGKQTLLPSNTKNLVPSAELSEEQNVNKEKGDPIIFEYHDLLLRRFVEYRQNPEDVLEAFSENGWEGLANLFDTSTEWFTKFMHKHFKTSQDWVTDIERVWKLFHIAIYKQIQSPPIISISKRALGYDFRRSQTPAYFTQRYFQLKDRILGKPF